MSASPSKREAARVAVPQIGQELIEALQTDTNARLVAEAYGRILFANRASEALVGFIEPGDFSIYDLVLQHICNVRPMADSGAIPMPQPGDPHRYNEQDRFTAFLSAGPSGPPMEAFVPFRIIGGDLIDARVRMAWTTGKIPRIMLTVQDLAEVDVDPLTKLWRRRRYDQEMAVAIGTQNRRLRSPAWQESSYEERERLAVMVIDIDHFKRLNDEHGHDAGDIALETVARRILRVVNRPGDFAARYGGEEFVVVLPETKADGAVMLGLRILDAVAGKPVMIPIGKFKKGISLRTSVSIGLAFMEPDDTARDLFKRADLAMYEAKRNGRNRLATTEPSE